MRISDWSSDVCSSDLLARLEKTLAPLRKTLGDQDYISGSEPAYSDYCVFGMFMWAHCVSRVDLLDAGDPIFKWRERLFGAFDGLALSAPTVREDRKSTRLNSSH